MRVARKGEGKSGEFRVCYAFFEQYGIVVLVTMFSKGEKDNLSPAEKVRIAILLREFEKLLAEGGIK